MSATLVQQQPLHDDWLLEVNLRLLAGNGAYGILFQDTNASYCLTIASNAQLTWTDVQKTRPTQTVSLPDDTALQAWHQLIMTVSGSVFSVQFDGIHIMEGVLTDKPHTFALFTERCSAAFIAISLTDHFRDEFLNDAYTPTLLGWHTETEGSTSFRDNATDWHIRDGAIEQGNSTPGTHILLKGFSYESCECGATMKLNMSDEAAALGLVLWLNETDKRFFWLTQDAPKDSALVIESFGTLASETLMQKLPKTFNLHDWHTLRLTYQNDVLTLFLDGPELLTFALPANAYKIGLATRNASAAFTSVWQTGC